MTEVAKLIADMVRAGVDPELIGRAAEALSQREPVRVVDEQAERKRAADRERMRAKREAEKDRAMSRDVADVGDNPSPKKETSPTPPKEKTTPSLVTANAVPSKKRATRLPVDWVLPKAWGDEAVAEGLSPDEVRSQAATMRDWSLSAPSGAKLDWHAAWRIWFRKAIKDRPRPRGSPPVKASSSSALADSAARLVQSMRSADEIRSGSSGPGVPALIPHLPVR